MEEYIKSLNIDPIVKAFMLELGYASLQTKEEIDAIVDSVEFSGNELDLGNHCYTVIREDDAYEYVEDLIQDSIDELNHSTKHDYDWLISCIDTTKIDHNIYYWYDVLGEFEVGETTYYYWYL